MDFKVSFEYYLERCLQIIFHFLIASSNPTFDNEFKTQYFSGGFRFKCRLFFLIQKEAVKREEAIASFEAWKKKKGKEAKKLSEQKKLEELKKKKTAEQQNEEKTEAAQKVM